MNEAYCLPLANWSGTSAEIPTRPMRRAASIAFSPLDPAADGDLCEVVRVETTRVAESARGAVGAVV